MQKVPNESSSKSMFYRSHHRFSLSASCHIYFRMNNMINFITIHVKVNFSFLSDFCIINVNCKVRYCTLPFQFRNFKIVYRRYAGLYFCICVDVQDNNLYYLEAIHNFVEVSQSFLCNSFQGLWAQDHHGLQLFTTDKVANF